MKTSTLSPRRLVLLLLPVTGIAVAITAFTWKDENNYYYKVNKGLEVFGQVYREVSQHYVDEIDPETFINAGVEGMLKTLDPYTVYLKKKDATDIDLLTSGAYGGIGITVGMRDSVVTVIDVVDGYSAQREGLRIGDRIQSINGADVMAGPVESLREYTRGEPGTTLTMSVLREGTEKPLTFTLTRENIKVRSVTYSGVINDGIGYIKLERFSTNAGDELRQALLELRQQGVYGGLVLDLRNNPGGLLESAVDVSSKFIPVGSTVVTTRGRDSLEDRVYRSVEEPVAADIPLVVLVNENSASASEIVAGAIQDLDAGVIMGTQSFGKGLVQSVRRLPYESTLKITTARYYTPSGRSIQKVDYMMQRTGQSSFKSGDAPATFRTLHGRTVAEHGGILPDTLVKETEIPGIIKQLRDVAIFFKFATRYTANMKSLPAGFTVDSELMRRFEDFVAENSQSAGLGSASVTKARELQAAAKSDGLDTELLRRIENLQAELGQGQRQAMVRYREDIRRELHREITARFQRQRERDSVRIPYDHQVQAAISLLKSGRQNYSSLLSTR